MDKTNYYKEIQKGNFALALTILDQDLIRDPENPELLYNFAICCSRTDNHKKCIETLNFLLKRSGRFIERDNVFRLIIYSKIQLKEFSDALELIKERLKVNTDDVALLSFKAFIQEKQGHIEESIKTHKRILTIQKENKNSLNSLGYLLVHNRNPDKEEVNLAIECLKKALALEPENPAYLDSFGVLLGSIGNRQQAEKALKKALAKLPGNQEILSHIDSLNQPEEKEKSKTVLVEHTEPEEEIKQETKPPLEKNRPAKKNSINSKGEASVIMQEAKTLMDEIMQHTRDFEEL